MYYIRILMIHIHTHLKGSVRLKPIHIQTHLKGNSHNEASGTRAAFHKLREQYIHTPHLKKRITNVNERYIHTHLEGNSHNETSGACAAFLAVHVGMLPLVHDT